MKLKSLQEINKLKAGGVILAEILNSLKEAIKPGITTADLDKMAGSIIKQKKVKPSFKGFQGYPATLCTSINEQLVHGLPSNQVLKEGDIIGIDCGIWHQGLCTDMAITVPVGKVKPVVKKLLAITKKSLDVGLEKVKPENTIGDFGARVQDYVEGKGLSVIRGLVGHGVGHEVHEEPRVPNFGEPGEGVKFKPGMVLALEPMVAIGDYNIKTEGDGWTIAMADRSLSAHFELTIAVTEAGYELITPKIW